MLEAMVLEVTGSKMTSLHQDLSTAKDAEILVFRLIEAPLYRETKRE